MLLSSPVLANSRPSVTNSIIRFMNSSKYWTGEVTHRGLDEHTGTILTSCAQPCSSRYVSMTARRCDREALLDRLYCRRIPPLDAACAMRDTRVRETRERFRIRCAHVESWIISFRMRKKGTNDMSPYRACAPLKTLNKIRHVLPDWTGKTIHTIVVWESKYRGCIYFSFDSHFVDPWTTVVVGHFPRHLADMDVATHEVSPNLTGMPHVLL